jgi:hypothetical protein
MTAVNWMPKYYKRKNRNPNDPNISISTQHTDRIGFPCIISQENISINKYSNILKAQKLKRITEDTMKIMEREEMCKECQNLERNPREKHTT